MRAVFIVATISLALAHGARADDAAAARQRYQAASAHFAVGEFADAGEEYLAAYKLRPDPAFLFNAAQAFRLGKRAEKALVLYKNFILFFPQDPNVGIAREQIARLKEAIAAAPPRPDGDQPPPRASSRQAAPPAQVDAPPVAAPPVAATTARAPLPKKTPLYKKWWLWTGVGAVVAGGAIAAAVVATHRSSWANAPDVGPALNAAVVRW